MAFRTPSIRQRLLNSSLLAVLGGYVLLLTAHALFSSQERRSYHQALAGTVRQELLPVSEGPAALAQVTEQLGRLVSPNLMVWIETDQGVPYRPPRQLGAFQLPRGYSLARLLVRTSLQHAEGRGVAAVRAGRRTYLISATPLPVHGRPMRLRLLEDVTGKVQRERATRLLMILAAGVSTLFTGLLLRPALSTGLAPLKQLARRMQAIGSETLEWGRLPLQALPRELTPIGGEFNALLERLAASWEQQRDFVNGVSHELRTPISLIVSYAGLLRRRATGLSSKEREQLLLIEEEAHRMSRLVDDLLHLARADSRRLELACEPFDAAESLERVVERLGGASGGRLQLADAAPPWPVFGDAERYEQCVANLIENALKYAPAATTIRLGLETEADTLVTHVIDAGPGVPESERQLIFERFQRGRHSASVPGSGIGLAVVQVLMAAMGGSVQVAEAAGGGADFQLRLGRAPLLPAA